MLYFERKLDNEGFDFVIGTDEAGRGPLAGPVVAAAVHLITDQFDNRIDDSKKLTPQARGLAYAELVQKVHFGIGIVNEKIIDQVNILEASRIAMEDAVLDLLDKAKSYPKKRIHILVDGNVKLNIGIAFTDIIKGDTKSKSIAAASILAKVTRDRIMSYYDQVYPQYGFLQHKGYPTLKHREILKKIGASPVHRMTFDGV